jgi:hypothetical protein
MMASGATWAAGLVRDLFPLLLRVHRQKNNGHATESGSSDDEFVNFLEDI